MKAHTLVARIGTALLVALGIARQFGVYEAEAWLQGVYVIGFFVTFLWTVWEMGNRFFQGCNEWHFPETPYYVKGRWARLWWPVMYFAEAATASCIAGLFSAWFWFLWSWEPHLIARPVIWYRNRMHA